MSDYIALVGDGIGVLIGNNGGFIEFVSRDGANRLERGMSFMAAAATVPLTIPTASVNYRDVRQVTVNDRPVWQNPSHYKPSHQETEYVGRGMVRLELKGRLEASLQDLKLTAVGFRQAS